MAGAGYKLFNTGDVLTAAQVNTYLQEQVVMVFNDATARTTALTGVLAEGMISYLKDTNAVEKYDGSTWSTVGGGGLSSPLTTKGDLWTYTTTNARLGVGSNGQVLTADSAETTGLKWATPAAGGGWTELASGSLTGSSVSITSISQDYRQLALYCRDYYPSADDTFAIRVNSTSSIYGVSYSRDSGGITDTKLPFFLQENMDNADNNAFAVMFFDDYANTNTFKTTRANALQRKADNSNYLYGWCQGVIRTTSAISSIQIEYLSGSNHSGGTYVLYGVK